MRFAVTILGSNSAFPAHDRYPSSQVLNHNEKLFLIDCGEGTQIRLNQLKIKRSKIDHVFISHLHGDHVFGLPGLITSFAQLGRTRPLTIYGPTGIRELIETVLRLSVARLDFELHFHEMEHEGIEIIFESESLRVSAFPLTHRIPTYGYKFEEKPGPLNMRKEAIEKYNLLPDQIRALKNENDIVLENGQVLLHQEVTMPRKTLRSFAYCSDTAYEEKLIPYIKHVTLLYHECTFLAELAEMAAFSKHSTTFQAAEIAKRAEVGKLITGHYSSRYQSLEPILEEVKLIFESAELGLEGRTFEISSDVEEDGKV